MSFAQKVAALRSFMGVPDDATLPAAVEMMSVSMGIAMRASQSRARCQSRWTHWCTQLVQLIYPDPSSTSWTFRARRSA